MNESQPHENLVKILHTPTEFEAHAKAAVLHEAGIEANVICDGASWAGMIRLSRTEFGASLWVVQDDVEAAKRELENVVADSVDLDWDEVDVGELEDDIEGTTHTGMPMPARFAWVVALFMVLLGFMLVLVLLFD